MIISASRRTDIPALYSEWLMNRLREGCVLIPNPRNPYRFSRVQLAPYTVDCIVFWTKNPAPMFSRLSEISAMGYPFYFQFTLTPYGPAWEPNLPPKSKLIETFRQLSRMLGPDRVVWRYDPVILTQQMDVAYHLRCFEEIAGYLEGFTNRAIFSFLDIYSRVRRVLESAGAEEIQERDMLRLAEGFAVCAQSHHMGLFTCCESVELKAYGIQHAACIDAGLIQDILGCTIRCRKDAGQRMACGCVESIEIGTYDSCTHGCKYCYATSSAPAVAKHAAEHDPAGSLLFGHLPENAVVFEREMLSVRDRQMHLF
jgi:DNA repair photolyase